MARKKRKNKINHNTIQYEYIFINGRQKRVKKEPTIDGMNIDEFIRRNADPIWLHQNEMWEIIDENENENENED